MHRCLCFEAVPVRSAQRTRIGKWYLLTPLPLHPSGRQWRRKDLRWYSTLRKIPNNTTAFSYCPPHCTPRYRNYKWPVPAFPDNRSAGTIPLCPATLPSSSMPSASTRTILPPALITIRPWSGWPVLRNGWSSTGCPYLLLRNIMPLIHWYHRTDQWGTR